MQNIKYFSDNNLGDDLKILPVDKSVPTHDELVIIESIFKEPKSAFLETVKIIGLLLVFFIIFSLPQIENLLRGIPFMKKMSIYIFILIKAVLFTVCYLVIKNYI